jgi:hypothetical protein
VAWEERAKKQEGERRRIKKHGRSLISTRDTPVRKRIGRRLKRKGPARS